MKLIILIIIFVIIVGSLAIICYRNNSYTFNDIDIGLIVWSVFAECGYSFTRSLKPVLVGVMFSGVDCVVVGFG